MRNISIALTALLAFCGLCGGASAAELHVPADHSTIQEAIDAAVDGDIIIIADDTYTGPDNKNLDFAGRAITLMSENGPNNCMRLPAAVLSSRAERMKTQLWMG